MLTAKEALDTILSSITVLGTETIALERALQRVLAEPVDAEENIPPFDNSAMDGYALRSIDLAKTPVTLTVVGEVAAGSMYENPLGEFQACAIMTGAPIPGGADAVAQIEWTEPEGASKVRITKSIQRGHNIRPAGADVRMGTRVLERGKIIRPQEMGLLASLGKRFVEVHAAPRVAVVATGNEIVDIHKPLGVGKIRNSNTYTLLGLLGQLGCEAKRRGIAGDSREGLLSMLRDAMGFDVIITTGGVSVGKYDLVVECLKELGASIHFTKVKIKPGMPLVFGTLNGKPVFGLPGNPVSTMVTFLKFVRPALLKMMGTLEQESSLVLRAKLGHELTKADGKRHYVRGILESVNGSLIVHAAGAQTSNILSSLVKANCLIILPESTEKVKEGEMVEVELLP